MNCFVVWLKNHNKQIRVFQYTAFNRQDMKRAEMLAIEAANKSHSNGYPCTIEHFNMCDVGVLVHDTDKQNLVEG